MAAAIGQLWPKAKPTLGPAIENGFYYDFDFGEAKIAESDFPKIEEKMHEIVKGWRKFEKIEVTKEQALKDFKGNEYKEELINDLADGQITHYQSGSFSDLCKGGHVENPSEDLKFFATENEAMRFQAIGKIKLRQPINVGVNGKIIKTTVGRIIFNQALPLELRFVNSEVKASDLKNIVVAAMKLFENEKVGELIDKLKEIGFWASTIAGGLSLSIFDCQIIPEKNKIINETEDEIKKQLRVTSLHYLTLEGMAKSLGMTVEKLHQSHCTGCLDYNYPFDMRPYDRDYNRTLYLAKTSLKSPKRVTSHLRHRLQNKC